MKKSKEGAAKDKQAQEAAEKKKKEEQEKENRVWKDLSGKVEGKDELAERIKDLECFQVLISFIISYFAINYMKLEFLINLTI